MIISRLCGAALGIALASVPLAAQTAPVPAQILTANKVFISNAGVDGTSLAIFFNRGDANRPYSRFYAAMKSWGRFELVGAPSDAELVFEVRFTAQLAGAAGTPGPPILHPQFELTILDARTHFILWTLAEPVEAWWQREHWFDQAITNLLDGVKSLAGGPSKQTG